MKKFLNGLGAFLAVIATFCLTLLIIVYVVLLNVRGLINERGLKKVFVEFDVVEQLKTADDGNMWNEILESAEEMNLNEKQLEEILNNENIRNEFASYVSKILKGINDGEEIILTKEEVKKTIEVAVDEYNKISATKITNEQKEELIDAINGEAIDKINEGMNEALKEINIKEVVPQEFTVVYDTVSSAIFGAGIQFLIIILSFVILIALLRFSYYKWMPYVGVSTLISGLIAIVMGVLLNGNILKSLLEIDMLANNFITSIQKVVTFNFYISGIVLIVISILLFVAHAIIKKHKNSKEKNEFIDDTMNINVNNIAV